MKILIRLKPEVRGDAEALERVKGEAREAGFHLAPDKQRLERVGILSGEVDPSHVASLEAIDGVANVEMDEEKEAL